METPLRQITDLTDEQLVFSINNNLYQLIQASRMLDDRLIYIIWRVLQRYGEEEQF